MSFSFTIQKWEWGMLQAQRCCEESRCMQNAFFLSRSLSPDESAIPFQAYLHTALTYSAYVHGMKVQISQQPGFMLIKLFGTRFSWIHAVMRIFSPRFLRSITCYHLMADALIWLMYNAQALTNKFSWDDWSCLKDDIPLTFGFDWNCHTLR